MKKFDYYFLSIIYAPIFPILLFMIGWWVSVLLVPEKQIVFFVLAGLALGIVIDGLFLKKVLALGYDQKPVVLAVIYLFFIVGIFGMFMGVPIFTVLPGITAAIYVARRASVNGWDQTRFKRDLNHTTWFATAVLLLICIASAVLALNDPYTGENISGMLGLSFEVTSGMIWGIVIVGGVGLMAVQYWVMKFVAVKLPGSSAARGTAQLS